MPTQIDLGDKGLREGDDIVPYLDSYWEDNTTVIIPAGEYEYHGTFRRSLSNAKLTTEGGQAYLRHDDGESVTFFPEAESGTVTVEDVTFKGIDEHDTAFRLTAESGATLELRNVNRPDGSYNDPNDSEGWYVKNYHAGTLRLVDCDVAGFGDNGLYGSAFGDPDEDEAGGGRIEVIGGRYENCRVSNVRVAGDSLVKDVVSVQAAGVRQGDGWHRGIRVISDAADCTIEDCDIIQEKDAPPIRLDSEGGDGGTGVIRDCRIQNEHDSNPAVNTADAPHDDWMAERLHLTGGGDYEIEISERNICRGVSCDKPLAGGNGSDSDMPEFLVAFLTTKAAGRSEYEMTVDGRIEPYTTGYPTHPGDPTEDGMARSTSNYNISRNADGTYTASGHTGDGWGDAYYVHGKVTDVTLSNPVGDFEGNPRGTGPGMWIELDKEPVTPAQLKRRTADEPNCPAGTKWSEEEGQCVPTGGDDDKEPIPWKRLALVSAGVAAGIVLDDIRKS